MRIEMLTIPLADISQNQINTNNNNKSKKQQTL
jgi:hypothetical protein